MTGDHAEYVAARRRAPVSWWTVGVFAVLLTAADGFWATSLRGAVGFIEATQQPFPDWVRYVAVMLPIFAGVVVGSLILADRLTGDRRGALRVAAAGLLVTALATAVAVAQISLTAAYDYRSQSNQLVVMHDLHDHGDAAARLDPGTVASNAAPACGGTCSAKQQTLAVHVRAIGVAAVLLLVTNVVLVLWALALRGGRVWTGAPRRNPTRRTRPSGARPSPAGGADASTPITARAVARPR